MVQLRSLGCRFRYGLWCCGLPPLLLLLCFANLARADNFLTAIKDVPLPAGFSELKERNLSFDKPSGRIVTAFAKGQGGLAAAKNFYHATLPQLGWRVMEGNRFHREGEILRLRFARQDRSVIIEFTLAPSN